jgi:hypothetical protein
VTAELQASRDQAEQQQRELDRANRLVTYSLAQHSSMKQQLQSLGLANLAVWMAVLQRSCLAGNCHA